MRPGRIAAETGSGTTPMMVYISYEEPGRSPWRIALGILAILIALAVIAALVIGILWWLDNNQSSEPATPSRGTADAPADAVPLQQAVTSLYRSDTNTIFLVDVSQSIEDGENLEVVKQSLLEVVLPYIDPTIGAAAENSQAALVTFTDEPEIVIPLGSLYDVVRQRLWLENVGDLTTLDKGAFIYDAVQEAHGMLVDVGDGDRDNVIVLLTDGADGGWDPGNQVIVPSSTGRDQLVGMLVTSSVHNLTLHTIGLEAGADHLSLQILAQATNGQYIYASR
jgi:Mg-chelatase subunit ChlD